MGSRREEGKRRRSAVEDAKQERLEGLGVQSTQLVSEQRSLVFSLQLCIIFIAAIIFVKKKKRKRRKERREKKGKRPRHPHIATALSTAAAASDHSRRCFLNHRCQCAM
ncbi:unnamed protein product [Musa textilis]